MDIAQGKRAKAPMQVLAPNLQMFLLSMCLALHGVHRAREKLYAGVVRPQARVQAQCSALWCDQEVPMTTGNHAAASP